MRKRWLAGLVALAMFAVSCGSGTPAASVGPAASVQAAGGGCSDLEIAGPSGTSVQLTGVWRSDDLGRYHIMQRESCLYWMGMSQDLGFGAGQNWTNVFTATIRNDFTIAGDWGDVPFNPDHRSSDYGNGSLVLDIDWDDSGEVVRPVLRRVAESGFFGGSVWVLEESLSDPVELAGAFGGNEFCVWVEAEGERVELIGSGIWTYRNPPLSIQDDSGHILARVGDPIVVRGPLSTVIGGECAESSILVDELDPMP